MKATIIKRDWAKYTEEECAQVQNRIDAWREIKTAYRVGGQSGKKKYEEFTDKTSCQMCLLYQDPNFEEISNGALSVTLACRKCPIVRVSNHTCIYHFEKAGYTDKVFSYRRKMLIVSQQVTEFLSWILKEMETRLIDEE